MRYPDNPAASAMTALVTSFVPVSVTRYPAQYHLGKGVDRDHDHDCARRDVGSE